MSVGLAIRFALLCCAVALVAAGCGGSSQLSRGDFITQANEACLTLTDKEHSQPKTDPVTSFNNNLGYLKDAVATLDKINPPAGEKKHFADMMKHFHANVTFLENNKKLLILLTIHIQQDPRDTGTVHKFDKFIKPFDIEAAAAKRDALKLALPACVAGFGTSAG